jgi:hypothetical protein
MPRRKSFSQHDVERVFRAAQKFGMDARLTLTADGCGIAAIEAIRPTAAPPAPVDDFEAQFEREMRSAGRPRR